MKVEVRIDPNCGEASAVITAPALTDEVRSLAARLEGGGVLIAGGRGTPSPFGRRSCCAATERTRGCAPRPSAGCTTCGSRLYELEGKLDRHAFARISHSEIVHLKQVTALDLSLSGTIRITLAGGTVCYASRRYVKKIKQALGL